MQVNVCFVLSLPGLAGTVEFQEILWYRVDDSNYFVRSQYTRDFNLLSDLFKTMIKLSKITLLHRGIFGNGPGNNDAGIFQSFLLMIAGKSKPLTDVR
jgi:hypothetical protein